MTPKSFRTAAMADRMFDLSILSSLRPARKQPAKNGRTWETSVRLSVFGDSLGVPGENEKAHDLLNPWAL